MSYNSPLWFPGWGFATAGSTVALTGSGYYVAALFQPVPGKTIDRICFYCTASSSGIVDVRLETMNGSGVPTGTLVAANTSLTGISVSANTLYDNVLTASYTVPTSATTYIAAKVAWNSGSATIRTRSAGGAPCVFPRAYEYTSSGAHRSTVPCITVRYTDGTYQPLLACFNTNPTNVTFKGDSSPNEYGNKFTPTENLNVVGMSAVAKPQGGASTGVLRITDDTGAVLTNDNENYFSYAESDIGATGGIFTRWFSSPIQLIAGRAYYVSILAVGTTNSWYAFVLSFGSVALREAHMPGLTKVTRAGGAWTETTTDCMMITPLIDSCYALRKTHMGGGFCG